METTKLGRCVLSMLLSMLAKQSDAVEELDLKKEELDKQEADKAVIAPHEDRLWESILGKFEKFSNEAPPASSSKKASSYDPFDLSDTIYLDAVPSTKGPTDMDSLVKKFETFNKTFKFSDDEFLFLKSLDKKTATNTFAERSKTFHGGSILNPKLASNLFQYEYNRIVVNMAGVDNGSESLDVPRKPTMNELLRDLAKTSDKLSEIQDLIVEQLKVDKEGEELEEPELKAMVEAMLVLNPPVCKDKATHANTRKRYRRVVNGIHQKYEQWRTTRPGFVAPTVSEDEVEKELETLSSIFKKNTANKKRKQAESSIDTGSVDLELESVVSKRPRRTVIESEDESEVDSMESPQSVKASAFNLDLWDLKFKFPTGVTWKSLGSNYLIPNEVQSLRDLIKYYEADTASEANKSLSDSVMQGMANL